MIGGTKEKKERHISKENVRMSSGAYRFKYCQQCGKELTDKDFCWCLFCK